MKKFFLIFSCASLVFADVLINTQELPKNIKEFIEKNFSKESIVKVEKDWDSYEIKLSNGTKIEFSLNGEIEEIDGKYSPIPDSIMPELTKLAKDSQKDAKLMEIDKKLNGYELKFSNNYKVYIDKNGKILSTVFDD